MPGSPRHHAPSSPNLIRLYRRALGMSVMELARIVHVYPNTIMKWEYGRALPYVHHALALAAALDCPVEILYYHTYVEVWKTISARDPALQKKRSPNIGAYSSIAALQRSLARASTHAGRLLRRRRTASAE